MTQDVGCEMMKKKSITIACLVASLSLGATLETALRSWSVHSWLSIAAHGHPIHRIMHASKLDGPIPEHYPVHTLESQRLVFVGKRYIGYASKHGFFVPDGESWESAGFRDTLIVVVSFWGRWVFHAISLSLTIVLVANGIRNKKRQPTNPCTIQAGAARS